MKPKEIKDNDYYWLTRNGWVCNDLPKPHELWVKRFETKKHSRRQAIAAQKKFDKFWRK